MLSRRDFLIGSTALLALPNIAFAKQPISLTAEKVNLSLLGDTPPTALWGYNGSTPGPAIRVKRGEKLQTIFRNNLSEGSAIHWHGMRIVNKMDGVPGLTQPVVKPGESFDYNFTAPDAGTYWYHSHNRSFEQVARGLYGAVIVDEHNPPPVDHDIIVFVDDWRLNSDGTQAGGFDDLHDQAHEGRIGNFSKAIFQNAPRELKKNQRVRLRLINAATDRIFPIQVEGVEGKIVAYDGMPLEIPEPLERIILNPAQRADIIADVASDLTIKSYTRRSGFYALGSLPMSGSIENTKKDDITALEPNKLKSPDLQSTVDLSIRIEGGAMSRHMMMGGMMTGRVWALNGVSEIGGTPMYRFKRGQTAILDLVNDTNFPHAMHLHGHHFVALNGDDKNRHRDTILVDVDKTQKIACVFDNPGKWLLHCHMLGHQEAGMKTWVEVT